MVDTLSYTKQPILRGGAPFSRGMAAYPAEAHRPGRPEKTTTAEGTSSLGCQWMGYRSKEAATARLWRKTAVAAALGSESGGEG